MAITIVNSGTYSMPAGTGNDTITIPSGGAEDDIVIIASTCDHEQQGMFSSGWTELFAKLGSEAVSYIYYKRMGATPDTTFDYIKISTKVVAICMAVMRGVDTTTELDAALTEASDTTGLPDPPSHTTVTDGAMRVITGHLDDDLDTLSSPSGFGDDVALGVDHASTAIGFKIEATAGALDPGAFTGTLDDGWWATHFSLRPAADVNINATTDALIISEKTAIVNAETSITATTDALVIAEKTATVQLIGMEQEGFRWRDDDGNETAATWLVAQDTDTSIDQETTIRIRVLANASGDPATAQATLQYKRDDEDASEWRTI